MNLADNWARDFVTITFMTFVDAQIIGYIFPNLIPFGLFIVTIRYFAKTWRMNEIFSLRTWNKAYQSFSDSFYKNEKFLCFFNWCHC